MKLDFIFHGGDDLNAKMYHTTDFDDRCRKIFERWHLQIESNTFFPNGRFLELPVPESDARLAIRTFWVKQAGARAECFWLGVKLSRNDYQEAGEYYRLVSALRNLSIEKVKDFASSGEKLELALTTPMHRQSIWKRFDELSGTCVIGAERFEENLENVLLSVSINNIDDWFSKLWLAIDPTINHREFTVVVSKMPPKGHSLTIPQTPIEEPNRRKSSQGWFGSFITRFSLFACVIMALLFVIKNAYDSGYRKGFREGKSVVREKASNLETSSDDASGLASGVPESDKNTSITNRIDGITE